MGIIYQCTNLINNKIYIGQTKRTLQERKRDHLGKSLHDGTYFHKAIIKYGKDNFQWEILGEYPNEELNYWENYWIEIKQSYYIYNKGYNMTTGDMPAKTTTNKKVRVFIQSLNETRDYFSQSEAARQLSQEFAPLIFSQEYISKICNGQAYSYYKDFFFNFLDDNDCIVPTNFIFKDKLKGLKYIHEKQCIPIKVISPDQKIYYFNSLKELEQKIGIEHHTGSKALKEQRPILKGKFKGWRIFNNSTGGNNGT